MRTTDKISHTQLLALTWAGVLAPAAELLPRITLPVAGKGAWLAPLMAVPILWLALRLLGQAHGEGLAQRVRRRFGRPILFIYMVWAALLLALRLRLCAQRLLTAGDRDGTLWFFLVIQAALVLWMGVGTLPALARAAQIILVVLAVTGAAVLLLALPKVRLVRILPLWGEDVVPVLTSAFPAAGVLGWGLAGAFLTGAVSPKKDSRGWYALFWLFGGCALLTVAQAILLGNLGPVLASRLDDPFFTLTKGVGIQGAFQRVESVVSALWTLADLVMSTVLVFAWQTMAEAVSPQYHRKGWTAALVGAAVLLALTFLGNGRAEMWDQQVMPWVNLILGLGLGILLALPINRPERKKVKKPEKRC